MRAYLTECRDCLKLSKKFKDKPGYVGLCSNKIITVLRILILIQSVCGRITVEETREVHRTVLQDQDIIRMINPDGGLSPLRGFLWYTCGFMYNIRMFSCWMDVDYSVWLNNSGGRTPVYEYARNYGRDGVHRKLAQDEYEKKLVEYHQMVINLFPSAEGYLSIHTDKEDSLYALLNKCTDTDKYRILAGLLLLSEGLSVPLSITRLEDSSEILVLKDLSKDAEHFRISLSGACAHGNKQEPEITRNSSGVVDTIQFFIDNHNNWCLQCSALFNGQMPYGVFKSGGFLCTLQFLIQSYIFDYMESVESTVLFCVTVFDMLRECIQHSINKKFRAKALNIFNSYFIPYGMDTPGAQYYESVGIASLVLNRLRVLPFEHKAQIFPITTFKFHNKTVHRLERITEDFLNLSIKKDNAVYTDLKTRNHLPDRVNSVETVLLCLFCCFAYDQYKQEYTVSHIPNASKELKEFFNKYKYMFDMTTEGIHNNWNKVVADLNNPYICYARPNKNQLDLGVINTLCVITEVAGIFDEHKPRINKFIETIKRNNKLPAEDSSELQQYIKELFKALSVNKNIRIGFLWTLLNKSQINRPDLFMDMIVHYRMNEVEESVFISIYRAQTRIDFRKAPVQPLLHSHKTSIKTETIKLNLLKPAYMQQLVLHYVNHVSVQYDNVYFNELNLKMSDWLNKKVPCPMNMYINPILVVYKIQSTRYKLLLIRDILLECLGINKAMCTGAINLVSNILGSIPFNNTSIRNTFFTTIIHCGADKEYYSRISISTTVYPAVEFYHHEISIIINKLLDTKTVHVFVSWLKYLLSVKPCPFLYTLDYILDSSRIVTRVLIFEFITVRCRTVKYINQIIDDIRALKVNYPDYNCEETVNTLLLSLICIHCQYNKNISIIQPIYEGINESMPVHLGFKRSSPSKYYKNAIDALSSIKDVLCRGSENKSKYDKVLSALLFKYSVKQQEEGMNLLEANLFLDDR
ncbi:uncharacterized protein NEPG_02058 [Nematocida parisii ERTm1]|uniref:uncharacterized protein n=1 Tax=Nematocida parisii (strain ERTm1 / ATCC PRA-289) TaxID=881290 RepID=UPI000264B6E3|nr:uncharacterized protein NEPG_02058 [Nematocida parisii ERTm1]EIJ93102.1 hypothetical protein NEPG_02058 [Nematocida parisii ERTm1]|eukprot:XP_013059885.1 hypothetical protein NEPG_02058 [Nematocida parisii ERTm1]